MRIMPGAAELCGWLDSRGVPRGLLTRNVRASVEHFHANHLVPHAPFRYIDRAHLLKCACPVPLTAFFTTTA